jgi:hypothetical protein
MVWTTEKETFQTESLQEERGRLLDAGKETAREQQTILARGMDRVARALSRTARNLEEEQDKATARYFDIAAEKIGNLSSELENKDMETLFTDSKNFARSHPALVFGGALTAGLVLSRFMKSSGERSRHAGPRWQEAASRPETGFEPETKVEVLEAQEADKRKSRPYGAVTPGEYSKST